MAKKHQYKEKKKKKKNKKLKARNTRGGKLYGNITESGGGVT